MSDFDTAVRKFIDETRVCSTWNAMQRAPSYATIEAAGEAAIPALLRNLASNDPGGMCVMHALAQATQAWPEYDAVTTKVAPGWVGFDVEAARQAWIRWGREQGHLPSGDER